MAVDPDQDLVEAAQAGDASALEALLRRHHDRVHLLCRRLTGSDADALDATQEALIAVVRGLPRFDGRSRFTTWLHRVATNACLDELRRRRRRPLPGIPDDAVDDDEHPHRALADPRGEEGLQSVADRLLLDDALAELPVEFRAAVVLRDVCDLDYAEIAAVLEVPPGTVRSRIARGRRLLARRLGPDGTGNQEAGTDRPSTTAPEPPTPPRIAP